ncbi:GerMN domain-containing protein [Metabacillus sp. KIGAM252]|uniref:GerMN domain-containing protein n=1 Tax=Metabacillus flavus TaxID=2823519 RepID=A0ABS5LH59_9BACI|nr:GerMN domain-containing protein [Metabacillus flavus]MBS2969929.1 GerMN domain-containing protein [Metabacillus flavus]
MPISKKLTIAVSSIAVTSIVLSGCGLFGGGEQAVKEVDPPQDVTYTDGKNAQEKPANTEKAGEQKAQTVSRDIYLIDKNGMVVSQALPLPKQEGAAKQVLTYLVDGGPVSNMLPDGFRAVLPADTEVLGVTIKDGTATADFSKEFANYKREDERKILQSVTWTLTQFESVKKVKIWVNGHPLNEMPVNGTPISEDMGRADGINLDTSDVTDITNTHPVTVYFLGQNDNGTYYVPVTRRVDNKEKDPIAAAVGELLKGPSSSSGLLDEFQGHVKLNSAPKYENGKVTLDFNKSIYGSYDEKKKVISEKVLNSLVLTLTEQQGVETVALTVDGKADLQNEKGQKLAKPVARPANVNTGSF